MTAAIGERQQIGQLIWCKDFGLFAEHAMSQRTNDKNYYADLITNTMRLQRLFEDVSSTDKEMLLSLSVSKIGWRKARMH
jgi:hypothetical protein